MSAALSGMAQTGNPREPMDRSALAALANASADYTSHAILHPRYAQPASDPAFFPTTSRVPVLNAGENGGARYGLQVAVQPPIMHEAGPTTANGRVIQRGSTGQSFAGGAAY